MSQSGSPYSYGDRECQALTPPLAVVMITDFSKRNPIVAIISTHFTSVGAKELMKDVL